MTGRSVHGAVAMVGVVCAGFRRLPLPVAFAAVSRGIGAPRPVRQ
jgi:hypothetical protein